MDGEEPERREFCYQYRSNGVTYRLNYPVPLPYEGDLRELAIRLVGAHKIPCHLEDELCAKLQEFVGSCTLEVLDAKAENNFFGGSVFEKGSETDQTIDKWVTSFSDNCTSFSTPSEIPSSSSDAGFSEIYHKLIHSPALETLLQLEHTYAMAVDEVIKAWENAREIMQKRQEADLAGAMRELDAQKGSEHGINVLMRRHTLEREACEERWSNELTQLRDSQRREYRDWVTKVYEDMQSQNSRGKRSSLLSPPKPRSVEPSSSPSSSDGLLHAVNTLPPAPLEESFTINLGNQKKTMHNVRLIRGDPLTFCQHKRGGVPGDLTMMGPNPERLQTAMSLYSSNLSAIVLMVDGRVNSLVGLKEAFANVCHESTDFHFPDVDTQLRNIQECALIGNVERQDCDLSASFTSTSSGSPLSQDTSQENNGSTESSVSPRPSSAPTSFAGDRVPGGGPGLAAGMGVWSGEGSASNGSSLDGSKSSNTTLQPGDFYLTRHSNLSQVHAVFHLVSDESVIMSSSLKTRHPIMMGLKSCLRTATRHDFTHITVPLLLVHTMQPEMTINWCMRRAEMVFKCVKGFMLENTAWTESESRTVQFLVPTGISEEMFEEFCDLLPKIFRVASSRNLTSRTRTYSYK